jgi:hypothetical protein
MPVMLVESVIAGVVVELATVPDRPLAETTETLVTLPEDPAEEARSFTVPLEFLK